MHDEHDGSIVHQPEDLFGMGSGRDSSAAVERHTRLTLMLMAVIAWIVVDIVFLVVEPRTRGMSAMALVGGVLIIVVLCFHMVSGDDEAQGDDHSQHDGRRIKTCPALTLRSTVQSDQGRGSGGIATLGSHLLSREDIDAGISSCFTTHGCPQTLSLTNDPVYDLDDKIELCATVNPAFHMCKTRMKEMHDRPYSTAAYKTCVSAKKCGDDVDPIDGNADTVSACRLACARDAAVDDYELVDMHSGDNDDAGVDDGYEPSSFSSSNQSPCIVVMNPNETMYGDDVSDINPTMGDRMLATDAASEVVYTYSANPQTMGTYPLTAIPGSSASHGLLDIGMLNALRSEERAKYVDDHVQHLAWTEGSRRTFE